MGYGKTLFSDLVTTRVRGVWIRKKSVQGRALMARMEVSDPRSQWRTRVRQIFLSLTYK